MNNEIIEIIKLSPFGASIGTRELGREIRDKAISFIKNDKKKVLFDFSDVHLISSAFADELFGKLFVELGKELFKESVKVNMFTNDEDRRVILLIIKEALDFRNSPQNLSS
jgi:hypothetical protein